jgi:hypothetical protein
MKLIRKIRLKRIHAFLLGAIAAYCSMQITSYVTTPADLRFSFESYQTSEEAEDRILHLFPIGSNADVFFDFMKRTGAGQEAEEKSSDGDANLPSYRALNYIEPRSLSFFAGMQWRVKVYIDQNRKITDLIVSRHITGA